MAPLSSILLTAGLAMQASAATIQVTVGQNNQLSFSPNEVKAAMGDVVEFHFAGGNHSVVEGDFSDACQPAATNAFFSGYMNALSGPAPNVFSITVNTTDPIPFYCSQLSPAPHCPFGMVGVINPSGSNTAASFAASAKNAQTVTAPAAVSGGVVGPASGGSSTSSSAPAATTSASSGGAGGPYGGGGSTGTPSGNGVGSLGASLGGIAAAIGFALYLA